MCESNREEKTEEWEERGVFFKQSNLPEKS